MIRALYDKDSIISSRSALKWEILSVLEHDDLVNVVDVAFVKVAC